MSRKLSGLGYLSKKFYVSMVRNAIDKQRKSTVIIIIQNEMYPSIANPYH